MTVRDTATGAQEDMGYDKLIIATGASPIVPPVEGVEQQGIFVMRTPDDAMKIRDAIAQRGVRQAVVVGGGFIGLEAAENLHAQGVQVTVIEDVYKRQGKRRGGKNRCFCRPAVLYWDRHRSRGRG